MPDLAINYAHAWESMTKGIDQQGPYYQVKYYFQNWADSDTIANQMRGSTQRSGGTTIRIPPHTHFLSPNLSCTDVSIEGCGSPVLNAKGLPSFDRGFFAIATYRSLPWLLQASNDPENLNQIDPTGTPLLWCTQELDFDFEEVVFEGEKSNFKWSTGDALNGTKTKVPLKFTMGITTMTITWHQLPYLPMATIRTLRNKINNATFLGAPAETIRFLGCRTVRDQNTDGQVSQKVQFTFQERDISWNKFLRKDKFQYDYIKDGGGATFYQTADLSPLLQP